MRVRTLDPLAKQRIIRLAGFNLTYVGWKCLQERAIAEELLSEAELEFRRFVVLVIIGYSPLGMLGRVVDEFWHQLILFTREYQQFCESAVGTFLHHQPDTPVSRVPKESGVVFVRAYRRHFGELPTIWFERMPKEVRDFYSQKRLYGNAPDWGSAWVADPASIARNAADLPLQTVRKALDR